MDTGMRQVAPAAERNKEPILTILRRALPESGRVLEIASGTGQHVVHFAGAYPEIEWQPSERDPRMLPSISAWVETSGLANVRAPIVLDVCAGAWPAGPFDAILCINMVHISPWRATLCLMEGAGAHLRASGLLYLYGPFRRSGVPTAPSNEAFDAQLGRSDPEWGLRDLDAVEAAAAGSGLALEKVVEMPANNLSLLFRRV
ncbi:DUF938 domain-containing protein [Propylenella binzhouense]|uniref:DUF938 domain-containing protein n=1 Tax=Propylenella binzhouense TaxID=2555902 RepID=A0A964T385_9HYPH|nr:DUF938 domain-containing protein [Propylenella binzhouense]MYZ47132.1 DUF938 domain-containing protein [Propylenella binzhouense]